MVLYIIYYVYLIYARWILWNFISSKILQKLILIKRWEHDVRFAMWINIFFSKKFYCNCMSVIHNWLMKRIERIVRTTIIQDNNSSLTRKISKYT